MPVRPDLYVLARLLQRFARGDAIGRGELQVAARVNYDLLRTYLDFLLERGLVREAARTAARRCT